MELILGLILIGVVWFYQHRQAESLINICRQKVRQ